MISGDERQVDAVLVSDYAKGVLTERVVRTLIADARAVGRPVIVDPKGRDFSRYRGASVLLARRNFGCGSSREHAPWALEDFGFRVVIAPSFADIFYNNAFKNGILLIPLDEATIERLFRAVEANEGYRLAVDLEAQSVTTPDGEVLHFEVDAFRKHCLLNGLDDIGLTLEHEDAIRDFEQRHRAERPWLFREA